MSKPPPSPAISLVMPAWNEEKYIVPTLDSVDKAIAKFKAEKDLDVEVIVVDNDSTDRTAEIARSRGCRVVSYTERHQMASVRNAGARHARAPMICFVDSDRSILPEGVFCEIYDNLSDDRIFGGGTDVSLERYPISAIIFLAIVKAYFWLMNLGAVMFYMRKADFDELGGFDEEYWAAEDVEMAFRMRDLGRKKEQRFRNLRGKVNVCMRKDGMIPVWHAVKTAFRMACDRSVLKDRAAWDPIYYDVDNLR